MGDSSSLAAITGDIWPKERALVARQLAIVAGATYSSEWLARGDALEVCRVANP